MWSKACCDKFRSITKNTRLRSNIVSLDGIRPELEIFARMDSEWISVGDELVRLNLVSRSTAKKRKATAKPLNNCIPG